MWVALAIVSAQAAPPPAMIRSGREGTPAEQVVQRQLEAYNRHDIEAFAATYSDDVEIVRHPGAVQSRGKAALKTQYGPLFDKVKPKARIPHRTVMSDRIADVEAISVGETEHCCALAIYEVKDGLIRRVDLIASDDFMRPKKK